MIENEIEKLEQLEQVLFNSCLPKQVQARQCLSSEYLPVMLVLSVLEAGVLVQMLRKKRVVHRRVGK